MATATKRRTKAKAKGTGGGKQETDGEPKALMLDGETRKKFGINASGVFTKPEKIEVRIKNRECRATVSVVQSPTELVTRGISRGMDFR